MNRPLSPHALAAEAPPLPRLLVFVMAAACGLSAANLYYAQPLIGPIGLSLGMAPQTTGLIVTMTQIGYVLGLLFVVPLGDLLENRRLMVVVLSLCSLALLAAATSRHATPFLLAMLAIGTSSVVVQILVPFSAHLAPEASRGRVVGTVTSGLMIGIMMSRPIASFVTFLTVWPVIFYASAVVIAGTAFVLARALPRRQPPGGMSYGKLLRSMAEIAITTPLLRRRAAYQFCLFFAFSLFWTTVPLHLAGADFGLTQAGIAWFSLAAVAGAVAAPLGGALADRGYGRLATGFGIGAALVGFLISNVPTPDLTARIGLLTLGAIVLDFGVAATLVTSQRALFALGSATRSRMNGLFLAFFFIGGALGSALGGWTFAHGGWPASTGLAIGIIGLALLLYATEFRRPAHP